MFAFSTKEIDKLIEMIKGAIEKDPHTADESIERILTKHEGNPNYLRKYIDLNHVYESLAEESLYFDNDIEKSKGFFYLAAKAGDICFKLYEKGYNVGGGFCIATDSDFANRRNAFHYAAFAIVVGREDLALSITLEDSLAGAVLMEDYERAKSYLPQNIKDIPKYEYLKEFLWTIVYNDEKKFQKYVEKDIRTIRRQARFGGASGYMYTETLALIKLARKRGMNFKNINIIELPMSIIDDTTPVNPEKWKLPEDKEVEKILALL